jgi:hypothetical protein
MRFLMTAVSLLMLGTITESRAAGLPCNAGPLVVFGTLSKRTVEEANGQQRTSFTLSNPTCGDRPIAVTVQGILACREGARVMVRGQYSAADPKAPVMGPATASCSGGPVGG